MHPKTLSMSSHRLVLMANVKDAPFKCLSCKKVFITENHLKRHEDRRHNSKNLSLPPEQAKEGTICETANESTIKAVLNATERIEDLLIKLAVRENEKKTTISAEDSSPQSNFDYSLVTSSSFSPEKNEQNLRSSEYISNDNVTNQKQVENAKLFNASLTSNYITTNTNELNIDDNYEYSSISNIVNTDKNEPMIENCGYSSNEVILNNELKETTKLKFNERSHFKNNSVVSNSVATGKNELDIKNYEYSSNESTSNKMKLKDMLYPSDSFTLDQSKQHMESSECISNYSVSNKKQKDIAELKYSERSDVGDMPVASESYILDKSDHMESSEPISMHSIPPKRSKNITKMTCSDYLEEQENKAIWRITSSIIKSSNYSLEVLDPIYSENSDEYEKNHIIAPQGDIFIEERPVKCRSSFKSEILKKLDSKLESYGVDTSQNTLSDKDMTRIGHLLKEERDRIAEEIPDYHKLRKLIKHNAHRRIEENLRVRSTYVS